MALELNGKALKSLRLPTTDYNGTPIQITPAQQGDLNSRLFKIQLYDDRGNIDPSVYSLALLSATRIDDELFIAEGEIKNGFVYFTLTPSMLAELGRVSCDVTLTGEDAEGNDTILTSQTFYVYVARSQLVDNDLVGSENYNILVTLIRDVREIERMLRLLEAGITDAEGLRVLAENDRASNEQARQANESQRIADNLAMIAAETGRVQAESNRVSAEQTRVSTESVRVSNESGRISAEAVRVQNETLRKTSESGREAAESDRVQAESNRAAEEQVRVFAEEKRIVNEGERQVHEILRREGFDRMTFEVAETIDKMQVVADEITETANRAENLATEAVGIAEQAVVIANTATTMSAEAVNLSADAVASSARAEATASLAEITAAEAVSIAEEAQAQAAVSASAASEAATLAQQSAVSAESSAALASSAAADAELARNAAEITAESAVTTANEALEKATSLVERADAGEFKGDGGEQGKQGEDGTGFFALDGQPWTTAQLLALIPEIKPGDFIISSSETNRNWGGFTVSPGTVVRVTELAENLANQWRFERRGAIRGIQGIPGPPPVHQWNGTHVRFQNPGGGWGEWIDLTAPAGAPGLAPAHQWQDAALRFQNPDGTWGSFADLRGEKGNDGQGHPIYSVNGNVFFNFVGSQGQSLSNIQFSALVPAVTENPPVGTLIVASSSHAGLLDGHDPGVFMLRRASYGMSNQDSGFYEIVFRLTGDGDVSFGGDGSGGSNTSGVKVIRLESGQTYYVTQPMPSTSIRVVGEARGAGGVTGATVGSVIFNGDGTEIISFTATAMVGSIRPFTPFTLTGGRNGCTLLILTPSGGGGSSNLDCVNIQIEFFSWWHNARIFLQAECLLSNLKEYIGFDFWGAVIDNGFVVEGDYLKEQANVLFTIAASGGKASISIVLENEGMSMTVPLSVTMAFGKGVEIIGYSFRLYGEDMDLFSMFGDAEYLRTYAFPNSGNAMLATLLTMV